MTCPVCSSKVHGFPCEVCGHDARTRPAPPKAPPEGEGLPMSAGVLGQRRAARRYGPRVEFVAFESNRPRCSKCSRRPQCNEPFWVDPDPPRSVTCNECWMRAGGEDAMVELGYKPRPKAYDPASHQGGLHRWPLDLAPPVALHGIGAEARKDPERG